MIPIRDENRPKTRPIVTPILIIINVAVFIFCFFSSEDFVGQYAMVPVDILGGEKLYTVFTSMFLHANIFHIGGNMLFLYVFGDNVEDAFGRGRYLLFYLLCGLAADVGHVWSVIDTPGVYEPTIGASGAISGVLGAYMLMYPKARVLTFVPIRFIWLVRIPAVIFLGFWFLLQLLYSQLDIGGGVAYWAHIGGFIAGMILGLALIITKKIRR